MRYGNARRDLRCLRGHGLILKVVQWVDFSVDEGCVMRLTDPRLVGERKFPCLVLWVPFPPSAHPESDSELRAALHASRRRALHVPNCPTGIHAHAHREQRH
jgi:hypothetical protein